MKKDQEKDFDVDILSENDLDDEEMPVKPKKRIPPWAIWPVVGVIVIIAVLFSMTGKKKDKEDITKLNVVKVTDGDVKTVYNSSGTIESEKIKTYYSPVNANILNCYAQVGQLVKSGDLLIRFDTSTLEEDNKEAQLTLQSAYNSSKASREQNAKTVKEEKKTQAALDKKAKKLAKKAASLKAQMNEAKQEYKENKAAYASAKNQAQIAALQEKIAGLEQTIQDYEKEIETLSAIYDGTGKDYQDALAKKNVGTASDSDKKLIEEVDRYQDLIKNLLPQAKTDLEAANAKLTSKITIDDAGYPALKEEYKNAYDAWKEASEAAKNTSADTGMTSSELENLDISDNLAELAALPSEELLKLGREGIRADMDGVVASLTVGDSNAAAQGGALFSIASTSEVCVGIEVSPDDYASLTVGTPVDITMGDSSYTGQLTSINRIAVENEEGTPTIDAKIHVNDPDEDICIGATVKISMVTAEAKQVPVIPTESVNASSDGNFVFVIENDTVKKKPVELGVSSVSQVEVKSGLKKGDYVVDELSVDIKEGMKAEPKLADKK